MTTAMPGRTVQLTDDLERYRSELTRYCYRMLGSAFEADDAVQETMVRAWRGIERFEGRSTVRSWLYRIATNACLDLLRGRQRRARPMDLGPVSTAETFHGTMLPEHAWVQPMPDRRVLPEDGDPAELTIARETIRLAFVTALQHLPARQRAVLILRDVLRWQATEVAELLDTTVASANSALQRARATLATLAVEPTDAPSVSADQQAVIARYVDAFERYDVPALVALLHDEVVMSMPPYDFWLHGPAEMGRWFLGGGSGCRGSRLVATTANGGPAFGSYRPDGRGYRPFALQVIELSGDRIVGHHNFIDSALFAVFGLPAHLASDPAGHDVSQADELEQSHQLPRGVPHPDRVAHSPGDELQSGQAVDHVKVGTNRRQGPAHQLDVTQHQGHDRVRVWALHTATTTAGAETERRRR